jgi:hypothetical protein
MDLQAYEARLLARWVGLPSYTLGDTSALCGLSFEVEAEEDAESASAARRRRLLVLELLQEYAELIAPHGRQPPAHAAEDRNGNLDLSTRYSSSASV